MTLQQEVYSKIDKLSDDGIRVLIDMIDSIELMSDSGFKRLSATQNINTAQNNDVEMFPVRPVVELVEEDEDTKKARAERKKNFLASAGKVDIDEDAIRLFRERSMV